MSANQQVVETKSSELIESDDVLDRILAVASNPDVNIDVFERLVALRDEEVTRTAKSAYEAAMTAAQAEMKPIAADAVNPQTKSKYATYAALDADLRPIYTKHGFSLSFNTKKSDIADNIDVVCDVSHIAGFSKQHEVPMPADGKGAKGGDVMTKTHATASAMTYGMRYLLKLIFNVAITNDDDGNAASGRNIAQELLDYNALVRDHWFTLFVVKKYLMPEFGENEDAYNATAALEAYEELDQDDQIALWRAPTKGGIFTTKERMLLKQPDKAAQQYGIKYI